MESTHKEYVVLTSKDEIFVLTNKEKEYLLENQDKRFVEFSIGIINPAYVTSIRADKIDELKTRFPCDFCHCSGRVNGWDICSICSGTGANIGDN